MSSQIFSQAQLKGLSTTLQVANYASAQFINNSNYGFTLSNANNNEVINYVEPWSNTVIPLGLATLKMVNTPSLNVANPFTPLQSSEQLTVVLSSLSVSSPSRQSMMSLTNVNITSGTVNANVSNNSIDTLVINDVSSPANVSQVNGSPIVSAFVSLSTSWQEVVVIGGVAQKILLSTVNATSTQLASDTTIFLSFDNGSSTFAVLLAGAILASNGTLATAGPFFTIDLSPGVSVSGLYASSNVTDLDIVATVII